MKLRESIHQQDPPKESDVDPEDNRVSLESVRAGWGMASITPAEPVRLTGKNFSPYQQVYDSVYVRTFLFDNGINKILLINYDLWIIHPRLANEIRRMVHQNYPEITGLYFTANHSHTSIGGWASGVLGSLVVGGNSQETIDFIATQTAKSIEKSKFTLEETKVGFGAITTDGLVTNRLNEHEYTDHQLRVLKLEHHQGQNAVYNTFSAHSVFMDKDINTLSADYPGPFLNLLQQNDHIDFAAFAPGATGSHTPVGRKPFELDKMILYASRLADYSVKLESQITTEETLELKYVELPVDLRSPHFRVSNSYRFRPWLFNLVMGEIQPRITVLKIGNTVLVGLPLELSGEFYPEFDEVCQRRGLNLMLTTFNGWYLGYAPPKKYYNTLRRAETRDMNWFGPESGEYFVELIQRVLEIV